MLRRNGKPRSCEPCRISKIRCDHTEPVCSKCQDRGLKLQCFYHPAPMTKPAGTPRKQPEPRRRVVKPKHSETRQSPSHGRTPSLQLSPTISLRNDLASLGAAGSSHGATAWPTPPESATRTTAASDSTRSFYLGSTSYASVFAEEGPIPDALHADGGPERNTMSILDEISTPPVIRRKTAGSRFCQIGRGQSIVSKLIPFSLFEKSVKMYFEINKASFLEGPLVLSALPQLRIDLERLAAAGDESHEIYVEMTRNTARPLKVPSTMVASEFHTLFTGQNLRWETLGLVLILAGSNAQYTSPDDPIFTLEDGTRIDKDDFIEDMIYASNDCIHICQVHGAVNDIMIWLLYNSMMVISNFYGDNNHAVWRRMGDSISAIYAEGMHCESSSEEPFFLRECRRRIHAAAYRSDKTLATFFGRPPMMAWKYSDRELPLDLDDTVSATSDAEVFNEAVAKLDSNGWNTEGKIYSTSWIRLRCQLSVLKEKVLEQSLAGRTEPDVTEKLYSISADCRRTWESLPNHLRYDLYEEDLAWTSVDPSVTLRMLCAYLEYLHTDFQIHRMLRRHTQLAIPALLEISMRLLSTVLVFNKQRSHPYSIQRHVPTIALFYCLPSAGVLALELRRCTLHNVPLPGTVKRADVIRNLSVLISCLDWVVLPGDGNHKLCNELNKMLAIVLDEVLNYQPPSNSNGTDGSQALLPSLESGFFDIPMADGLEPIPTESEDFLNWLDNANWNNTVNPAYGDRVRKELNTLNSIFTEYDTIYEL